MPQYRIKYSTDKHMGGECGFFHSQQEVDKAIEALKKVGATSFQVSTVGKPDAVERLRAKINAQQGNSPIEIMPIDAYAVLAYVAELERDVAKLQRFPFEKICLVCGAPKPCELANDELSPCTFDRTPKEMHDDLKQLRKRVAELEGALREILNGGIEGGPAWPADAYGMKQVRRIAAAALTGGEKGGG